MRSFIQSEDTHPKDRVFLFPAKVTKVCYKIKEDGRLYIDIRTDKDVYIHELEKETYLKLPVHVYCKNIAVGDIVHVFINNLSDMGYVSDKSYFSYQINYFNENNRLDIAVENIKVCPVCNNPLHHDTNTNKVYCLNNDCIAKLIFTIRRYLLIATNLVWEFEELAIINKLVTIGRVKSLTDIYTLTLEELESLPNWFNNKERNVANTVYKKINQTRGTVTVYNFLNSLNIPRNSGWKLDKSSIDKLYLSMPDFVESIGSTDSKENKKLDLCMSKSTKEAFKYYFSIDKNLSSIIALEDQNVFDS